jgi:hypothetical protein
MKRCDEGYKPTSKERAFLNKATIRLARHLPSPSKLNACAIYRSNEAEKIVAYIEHLENLLNS